MRRFLAPLLVLPLLVLAGCGGQGGDQQPVGARPHDSVQVDSPQLRKLKLQAGIADCTPSTADGPAAEDPLPKVTLPCLGGGPDIRLAKLRGPMVINLWAQWCGPCREELPIYEELHQKGKGKVKVLGIDYLDNQPAQALQLAKQTGVTYPLLADPEGSLRADFHVRGLPGVVFVDAQGRVKGVQYAVMSSYAQLRGLVQDRLGVRLPR